MRVPIAIVDWMFRLLLAVAELMIAGMIVIKDVKC
jgi:hypothetical protein